MRHRSRIISIITALLVFAVAANGASAAPLLPVGAEPTNALEDAADQTGLVDGLSDALTGDASESDDTSLLDSVLGDEGRVDEIVEDIGSGDADDVVDEIFETVEEPVGDVATELANEDAGTTVSETLENVDQATVPLLDEVDETLDLTDPISDDLDDTTKALTGTVDEVTDAVHEDTVEPVDELLDEIVEPIVDDALAPVVDPALDPVGDAAGDILAPVIEDAQPLVEGAGDVIEPVVEAVGDALEPVEEIVTPAVEPVDGVTGPVSRDVDNAIAPVIEGLTLPGSEDTPVQHDPPATNLPGNGTDEGSSDAPAPTGAEPGADRDAGASPGSGTPANVRQDGEQFGGDDLAGSPDLGSQPATSGDIGTDIAVGDIPTVTAPVDDAPATPPAVDSGAPPETAPPAFPAEPQPSEPITDSPEGLPGDTPAANPARPIAVEMVPAVPDAPVDPGQRFGAPLPPPATSTGPQAPFQPPAPEDVEQAVAGDASTGVARAVAPADADAGPRHLIAETPDPAPALESSSDSSGADLFERLFDAPRAPAPASTAIASLAGSAVAVAAVLLLGLQLAGRRETTAFALAIPGTVHHTVPKPPG